MSERKVSRVTGNYNRIARDLDRARRIAGLSGLQNYLWDEARELSWAFAGEEGRPFRFNFSEMERISGRHRRQSLSRECRTLIDRRLFAEAGNGTLLINKDFREWLAEDGSPLFDAERVAWIVAINREGRTATKRLQGPQPNGDAEGPSTVTKWLQGPQPFGDTPCHQMVAPLSPNGCTPGVPPGPPIGERARQSLNESKRERELIGAAAAGATSGATQDDPGHGPCPPYPVDEVSPLMVHGGAHPEDPAWGQAFWRRLWAAFGSKRVCTGFYEHQRWYAPAAWEAALRELVRRGQTPNTVRLLETLAADPKVVDAPAESPRPAPAAPARGPEVRDWAGRPAATLAENVAAAERLRRRVLDREAPRD